MSQEMLNEQLIGAARSGLLKKISYYLDRGANVHAKDEKALKGAVWGGHLDVCAALLASGADRDRVDASDFEYKIKKDDSDSLRELLSIFPHVMPHLLLDDVVKHDALNCLMTLLERGVQPKILTSMSDRMQGVVMFKTLKGKFGKGQRSIISELMLGPGL